MGGWEREGEEGDCVLWVVLVPLVVEVGWGRLGEGKRESVAVAGPLG